ncbi:MAG: hypothetical protein A2020_11110 [Lentisphaerae bacterium GWF2_45_14]|nr:MAG: hypothetical protein A2020_11110 [Lentisphaerae bacterium GWF2_45_14]
MKFVMILLFLCVIFQLNAADSIIADSSTVFRPLKNSWTSIQADEDIEYDDGATGAFYGVFQIYFKLDKTQYYGNLKVEVYLRKEGGAWKKVTEIIPPAKPASGDWTVTQCWNSRTAANDWTTEDAAGYTGSLEIKLKVVEE